KRILGNMIVHGFSRPFRYLPALLKISQSGRSHDDHYPQEKKDCVIYLDILLDHYNNEGKIERNNQNGQKSKDQVSFHAQPVWVNKDSLIVEKEEFVKEKIGTWNRRMMKKTLLVRAFCNHIHPPELS